MPLTQEELDMLPRSTKLWFYNDKLNCVINSQLTSGWDASHADYCITEKEAEDYLNLARVIKKLKS